METGDDPAAIRDDPSGVDGADPGAPEPGPDPVSARIAKRRRRALRDLTITLALVAVGFPALRPAHAQSADNAGMYVTAGASTPSSASTPSLASDSSASAGPSASSSTASGTASVPASSTDTAAASTTPSPSVATDTPEIPSAPPSPKVPGTGTFNVVPLQIAAVGSYPRKTYRLEIEGGLPVDDYALATAVNTTLISPKGWQRIAHVNFAETDTDSYDFRLILASPAMVDRLCAPLDTEGAVSCRNGKNVVINIERWMYSVPGYPVATYRQYVVNHEVGHFLGHGHQQCPGLGKPAPVMMQQTKGLHGCTPNPWPSVSA